MMKIIRYYVLLLVFISLFFGVVIRVTQQTMSMTTMISLSVVLALYAVAMSIVGEGKTEDERALHHRYLANRISLIAGTVFLSLGVLFQLYTHNLDFWLLGGLVAINFVKIVSLLYSNYKN